MARLDGLAVGNVWVGRPMVRSGAMIQRYLKVGDCIHLGDTCGRCRAREGSSNNLKAIDDLILCGRCRDRDVGMAEFDSIGDNLTLVVHIDQFEAAI